MPACHACGGQMLSNRVWLFGCARCGLLHSAFTPGPGAGIEGLQQLRRQNFELLLTRVEKIRPLAGLRLLEVGCGEGWFLEAAQRRGILATGIEPEETSAHIGRANGLSVERGLFPTDLRDRGPYDVIVFNDVFEHLPAPDVAIQYVNELLAKKGLAILNFP